MSTKITRLVLMLVLLSFCTHFSYAAFPVKGNNLHTETKSALSIPKPVADDNSAINITQTSEHLLAAAFASGVLYAVLRQSAITITLLPFAVGTLSLVGLTMAIVALRKGKNVPSYQRKKFLRHTRAAIVANLFLLVLSVLFIVATL